MPKHTKKRSTIKRKHRRMRKRGKNEKNNRAKNEIV